MRRIRASVLAFAAGACLLAAGCATMTVGRADLMDFLEEGRTIREDVLMQMGEADAAAPDGSWLAYGSAYSEGGVIFVIVGGGSAA